MKATQFLRAAFILLGIFLSACGASVNPSAPVNVGADKSLPESTLTGTIESMNGDQWVVDGQTVTVDASALKNEPFAVGDTIKVEAAIAQNGALSAQRIEALSPLAATASDDLSTSPAPVVDDRGNELSGTVEAIDNVSVTINGQTFTFAPGVEIKDELTTGDVVKLHLMVNADGTLSVTEMELADPTQIGENNGMDDHSNDSSLTHDVNDDHGGDSATSDDGPAHDANDDHGGGSNDDKGNDDHSGGNSGKGG